MILRGIKGMGTCSGGAKSGDAKKERAQNSRLFRSTLVFSDFGFNFLVQEGCYIY